MAKINIYGQLNAATADGWLAEASQLLYGQLGKKGDILSVTAALDELYKVVSSYGAIKNIDIRNVDNDKLLVIEYIDSEGQIQTVSTSVSGLIKDLTVENEEGSPLKLTIDDSNIDKQVLKATLQISQTQDNNLFKVDGANGVYVAGDKITQDAHMSNYDSTITGDVQPTDTINEAISKVENKVNNLDQVIDVVKDEESGAKYNRLVATLDSGWY